MKESPASAEKNEIVRTPPRKSTQASIPHESGAKGDEEVNAEEDDREGGNEEAESREDYRGEGDSGEDDDEDDHVTEESPYNNVHVLIMVWEVCDYDTNIETSRLRTVFEQRYNFHIEKFEIPYSRGGIAIRRKLNEWAGAYAESGDALIVAYMGHGRFGDDGKFRISTRK